jgi:hypothetical protein
MVTRKLSHLGSRQELRDSTPSATRYDTSEVSLHKNNKIDIPTLKGVLNHTLSVQFKPAEIYRFVALAADDFEMPVSCARRLNDFCGMWSNPALISSSFPPVSTRRFF